jgi:ribose 5-phosphate isomerase B
MNIAISADHAGYFLKVYLVPYLQNRGHQVLDLGVYTDSVSADYPDIAQLVGKAIIEGQAERGIVICGSGVGACIAANKMHGIYASICHDVYSAAQGVQHDNMNVLCLGGRVVGFSTAETLVDAFLGATFEGADRFVRRFNKMKAIEEQGE